MPGYIGVKNNTTIGFPFDSFFKVYDTAEGSMVDMLKGHRDTIYCLAYESSGKVDKNSK